VVLRSLARDPEARFRSAEEMRSGLLAVDAENAEATPPAGITTPAAPARPFPARIAAGAGVILVAGMAALLITRGGSHQAADRTPPGGVAAPLAGAVAGPAAAAPGIFDPEGDGNENTATVGNLVDGNPATVWKTQTYRENFPKFKSGVGVFFDLGRTRKIRSVAVSAAHQDGWSGEVYVADRAASDREGWGKPRAVGAGRFNTGGASGRYVLVWFTSLPQAEGGYRLEVAEVEFNFAS
jgi:hypothetical protein